jgi:16S rRNA C967 or C1407 C5-methylase (RsmB/RsmF family)
MPNSMPNLPTEFCQNTLKIYGEEIGQKILDALTNEPAKTCVRINPNKKQPNLEYLTQNSTKVPWLESAYYLQERPDFGIDQNFLQGNYYPQDSSCMVIYWLTKHLAKTSNIETILDMCASPGGKSFLMSDAIPDSLVISNEVDSWRNLNLVQNVEKWQSQNIICTRHKAIEISKKLSEFFDLVLVDAPCSGEGMFRKDEESIKHWSPKNIEICQNRQQQILFEVFDSLKVGGYLIYSTCTLNTRENEDVINWLTSTLPCKLINLDQELETISKDKDHEFLQLQDSSYHLVPPFSKGEGFFFAVVQKTDSCILDSKKEENEIWAKLNGRKLENNYFHRQKDRNQQSSFLEEKNQMVIKTIQNTYQDLNLDKYILICQDNIDYFLFPKEHIDTFDKLKNLKVTRWCIPLGQMRFRDTKTWKPKSQTK